MKKLGAMLTLILIFGIFAYAYTQYLQKSSIFAVLQYPIDLQSPPDSVFAVSTIGQKLPDGKMLPKGTRFIGMLSKEEKGFVIYFDEIQKLDGDKEQFSAKSSLNVEEQNKQGGVSAKISKTLYQQTKTNVLGAIFNSSNNIKQSQGTVLPRGSTLKIEVD